MRSLSRIFIMLIISLCLFGQTPQTFNLDPYNPEYDEHTILIKFKDEAQINMAFAKTSTSTGIPTLDQLMSKYEIESVDKVFKNAKPVFAKRTFTDPNGDIHEVPRLDKIFCVKYEADVDPKTIVKELENDPSIEYVEPDYYVYAMISPDDPFYQGGDQWYIDAVNAPAAWDSTTSDTSQIIGVIDTGVDWDHPDLDDNIWTNWDEYNGIPGVDDDGNGFIDDIRGWDFVNDDNDPNDDNSHGTHVAGIAAAEGNNSVGISGIAWNARIMPVKMLQSSGSGSSSDLAAAIDYAANTGATIINMSLGSYGESYTVKIACENAYAYAVLVAAAGNDGYKVDPPCPPYPLYAPMYPACYGFVLGVEASTQTNSLAGFSNYDPSGPILEGNSYGHNYEVRAPGVGIYSTFPNGNYRDLSGTSMASPIVAGAVALMKSYNPSQSTEKIFARLIQSANSGILDIENCLNYTLEPDLYYLEYTIVDTLPGCDRDGIADAGETIEIYLTVKNAGGYADSVWSKLRFGEFEDTSVADIVDSTSYIGDISAYANLTGELDPIRIEIASDVANNRDVVFEYEIGAKNYVSFTGELNITVQNGIELSGIYTGTTVLYPDKYYIITESVVFENLIVKPGVTIRINPEKSILVSNDFTSSGNKDSLITYTVNGQGYWKGITSTKYPHECTMEYCVVEYADMEYGLGHLCKGVNLVENSIIKHNLGTIAGGEGGGAQYTSFLSNIIFDNNCNIGFCNINIGLISPSNNDFKYNVIYSNKHRNVESPIISFHSGDIPSTRLNTFLGNFNYDMGIYGTFDLVYLSQNYFGMDNTDEVSDRTRDYFENPTLPALILDSILTSPPSQCHGVVWKVDINDVLVNKYDNPYNDPSGLGIVGTETLKFDVYFNRAMDTTYTPFLTFGVREPYTQQVVVDSASWSADSTIWTAYYDVNLETGDGIQHVRVANAKDTDHFDIPIENSRFEFVIQAASAAGVKFYANAGIGKVDLEWSKSNKRNELGYNVYRYESLTDSTYSDTLLINSNLVTDTLYADYEVIPDSTYRYLFTVVSTDMSESDFSRSISATVLSAANGDANGDLNVNVLDIISIVTYMLQGNPNPFLFDAADLNGDGNINVLDLIGVVSIILNDGMGKTAYTHATETMFCVKEGQIYASSNGVLGGYQFIISGNVEDLSVSSEYPMEVVTKQLEDDKFLVLVYSLTGNMIPEGNHAILSLSHTEDITFSDLIVSDRAGKEVSSWFGSSTDLIVPDEFGLKQNYPNPFNASTSISYQLPVMSNVTLTIYNILGQKVYTQTINDQNPGYYTYNWNGSGQSGQMLSSGLYIYQIIADDFVDSKKMIMLK